MPSLRTFGVPGISPGGAASRAGGVSPAQAEGPLQRSDVCHCFCHRVVTFRTPLPVPRPLQAGAWGFPGFRGSSESGDFGVDTQLSTNSSLKLSGPCRREAFPRRRNLLEAVCRRSARHLHRREQTSSEVCSQLEAIGSVHFLKSCFGERFPPSGSGSS